jgi:O-phosphoseryl-tRNA(Cys) synthetase
MPSIPSRKPARRGQACAGRCRAHHVGRALELDQGAGVKIIERLTAELRKLPAAND